NPSVNIYSTRGRAIMYEIPHENYKVSASGRLITYTPTLEELGEPATENKPTEKWTAARWHNFRSDPDGKLWFEDDGRARLLAQYPPNGDFIHPIGTERVLVTAGREFEIFRVVGAQVSSERL